MRIARGFLMFHPCSSSSSSAITFSAIANIRFMAISSSSASTTTPVQFQKKALRCEIRKALKALSPPQRAQQDFEIQSTILSSSWFKSSHRLCAYISCPALREVQRQKELYVPRVEDKNSNMRMLKITTMDDLVANSMNILEPSPLDDKGNQREDVMSATDPVDLFLLPGVAFDKQGRRLGRGGGYYDVLLKKYQDLALEKKWNKPLLVALAYSMQIKEDGIIPITPTDMLIDAIVSSNGVISISPLAKEKMS